MNRSPSNKPAMPRIPPKKTDEEIAAQEKSLEKVDALSAEPVTKAMSAAGMSAASGAGKGRAKAKKTQDAPAPQADKAQSFVYPWNEPGMSIEKGFSTRIPASLHAKLGFLIGLDRSLRVGKITQDALEGKVDAMLRARGIKV